MGSLLHTACVYDYDYIQSVIYDYDYIFYNPAPLLRRLKNIWLLLCALLNQLASIYTLLVHILVATWLQSTTTDSQAASTMTSETLAKSLESDRKSEQGVAILVLVLVIVLGVYWLTVWSSHQGDPEKEAEEDVDGYHPTEEDYEYMDDDDFDEDDLDDEDYDLLEESDEEEGDFDEEESDDVRISDLLNETLL